MRQSILLFFLMFSFQLFSQNATVKTPIELNKIAKANARKQIQLLEHSVILFRLDSKSEQIAYYEKYENFKAASKLRAQTAKNNLRVIQAFRKGFTFCPVYFFEDIYSTAVATGNIDSLVFYNDSLQPDIRIKLPIGATYFIAEHGMTRDDDENKYRSDYYIDSDSTGMTKKTRYHDDGNLGVTGFILMDSTFTQLQRPFPYYSRIASIQIPLEKIAVKAKSWSKAMTTFLKDNP